MNPQSREAIKRAAIMVLAASLPLAVALLAGEYDAAYGVNWRLFGVAALPVLVPVAIRVLEGNYDAGREARYAAGDRSAVLPSDVGPPVSP